MGGTTTEGLVLLNWAFRGTALPPCLVACDVNADGKVAGITDAILILKFAFGSGDSPLPPFPGCEPGDAETDSALGCGTSPVGCP